MSDEEIGCEVKQLPESFTIAAAKVAREVNPTNAPSMDGFIRLATMLVHDESVIDPTPFRLAVLTTKYWGAKGVRLGVKFMESTPTDLQNRILAHMNAWGEHPKNPCKARFFLSNDDAQVRISRGSGGYWSYLGTDVLHIASGEPTMNLQDFTMSKSEQEFRQVVRHETGHTLGFPHEHMRPAMIARLDREKTIDYFRRTQGWNARTTEQQVLTPLTEVNSITGRGAFGTPEADQDSIMCYQLPGSITVDGQPIRGGADIDDLDAKFAARIYPVDTEPDEPTPPPPPTGGILNIIQLIKKFLAIAAAWKAKDWETLIKLVLELIGDINAGRVTDEDIAKAMTAVDQLQP